MDITGTTAEPRSRAGAARLRRLRPLVAWAGVFALLAAAAFLFGVILYVAINEKETAAAYAIRFFRGEAGYDSWRPMLRAMFELRGDPGEPLYPHVFFDLKVKFQYPLSSLFLADLVQHLVGGNWRSMYGVLNWISWIMAWGVGIVSWRLLLASLREAGLAGRESRRDELLLLASCLGLMLLFYPLMLSFSIGQIQTTMTLLLGLALLLWPRSRLWPGLFIGLCCAIKPQWAILLIWGAMRREWTMVAAGAAVFAGLVLVSGLTYGFANHLDYPSVVSFLAQHGESYYLNQSVNGLMNRLLFIGDNVDHNEFGNGFPDFNLAVYAVTLVSTIIILVAGLAFRWRQRPGRLDLALIVLSVTAASPIAWVHHYAVLLPIYAIVAPHCLAARPFGRWSGAYLLVGFILAGQRLAVTDLLAYSHWNVLQSHLLFAAAMVLVLLYRLAPATPQAGYRRVAA
jgi:alpha-1,2-mannosyltransferase